MDSSTGMRSNGAIGSKKDVGLLPVAGSNQLQGIQYVADHIQHSDVDETKRYLLRLRRSEFPHGDAWPGVILFSTACTIMCVYQVVRRRGSPAQPDYGAV